MEAMKSSKIRVFPVVVVDTVMNKRYEFSISGTDQIDAFNGALEFMLAGKRETNLNRYLVDVPGKL
jgi:hypothetical protein